MSFPYEHFLHVPPPRRRRGRLDRNDIGVEGAKAIAAVLKETQLVQLEYAICPYPPIRQPPLNT